MKRSTANFYLSKYILLRDAIQDNLPDFKYVKCRTCGKLMERFSHNSHAGHFITKGHGGSSGVYYDERNIHAQCHKCNVWDEGNSIEYYKFMKEKYGEEVIKELRLKHKLPRPYKVDYYGIYYREAYKELKAKYGLKK